MVTAQDVTLQAGSDLKRDSSPLTADISRYNILSRLVSLE